MGKEDHKTRCEWCDKRSMVSPCKECRSKESAKDWIERMSKGMTVYICPECAFIISDAEYTKIICKSCVRCGTDFGLFNLIKNWKLEHRS